ncbi:HNH endonuclease [Brevibacillus borstelensis]|uniref:HNH endonuclease n=1 Tax=Brevibacillus borstelensis TaxID=45462 RepID=UPI001562C46D|nr:HNH endonuclease [Brevibacillus borstelensis]MBE5396679.1 HNH endonuclease [Brevibacillus borstelensis]
METKICRNCGETKPLNDMVRDSRRKNGRDTICKSCAVKRERARYDSDYHVFKWHRRRAARFGTGTYMNAAEFTAIRTAPNRECAYCGSRENLGIDHVRPLQHYGPNARWNIVNACHTCNSRKRDRTVFEFYEMEPAFTLERFDALIAYMAEHNGCSPEHMRWLLEGYHEGELRLREQRKKRKRGKIAHEPANCRTLAVV